MATKQTKGNYTLDMDQDQLDTLMTVEEFRDCVENGVFGPDDGYGYPVKDESEDGNIKIYADDISKIPSDATHISWYSK